MDRHRDKRSEKDKIETAKEEDSFKKTDHDDRISLKEAK